MPTAHKLRACDAPPPGTRPTTPARPGVHPSALSQAWWQFCPRSQAQFPASCHGKHQRNRRLPSMLALCRRLRATQTSANNKPTEKQHMQTGTRSCCDVRHFDACEPLVLLHHCLTHAQWAQKHATRRKRARSRTFRKPALTGVQEGKTSKPPCIPSSAAGNISQVWTRTQASTPATSARTDPETYRDVPRVQLLKHSAGENMSITRPLRFSHESLQLAAWTRLCTPRRPVAPHGKGKAAPGWGVWG
jgi:hypothetical protein